MQSSISIPTAVWSPLKLLSLQNLLRGISDALFTAVAYALFLAQFGSGYLPYVFLVIAVVTPLASSIFNTIHHKTTVRRLVVGSLLLLSVLFGGWWWPLQYQSLNWVPFALVVTLTFFEMFGSIVVGVQTSRLFNVREIKTNVPIMLMFQLLGIALGGLATTHIAALLGKETHLILVAAAILVLVAILAWWISIQYPTGFSEKPTRESNVTSASAWAQLTQPFVRNVFTYQFLSTLGTSLALAIFLLQAQRYLGGDMTQMTTFMGHFLAATYAVAIATLYFVSKPLLRRWGLYYGLFANPLSVLLPVTGLLLGVVFLPQQALLLFIFACACRLIDVVFTRGATSPAIKAIYQIIPANNRVAVITAIGGVSTPLAFGATGLSLLFFQKTPGLTDIHFLIFTLVICVLWCIFAWLTMKGYRQTLQKQVNRNVLSKIELDLTFEDNMKVVNTLINSNEIAQVRLGLDILEKNDWQTYQQLLIELLPTAPEHILLELVSRIEKAQLPAAGQAIHKLLKKRHSPTLQQQLVKTLVAIDPVEHHQAACRYLRSTNTSRQVGAMIGLLKYGGVNAKVVAGEELLKTNNRSDTASQKLVATVIGEIGDQNFYAPLITKLNSSVIAVRQAALEAAGALKNPRLLPDIIANLDDPATRSTALNTLLQYEAQLVNITRDALEHPWAFSALNTARFIRALGQTNAPERIEILTPHIDYPDPVVRTVILATLRKAGYREPSQTQSCQAQLEAEIDAAIALFALSHGLGTNPAVDALQKALLHPLGQIKKRIFSLLCFRYGEQVLSGPQAELTAPDRSRQAIALETLDVLFSTADSALLMPLLDPDITLSKRLAVLRTKFTVPTYTQLESLQTLIETPPDQWVSACAIKAAVNLQHHSLTPLIQAVASKEHAGAAETAKHMLHPNSSATTEPLTRIVQLLHETVVFDRISPNILTLFASQVASETLTVEQSLIQQSAAPDKMFIIADGEVEVRIDGQSVITLGKNQTVGELALFTQQARAADVVATMPTNVLSIGKQELQTFMAEQPEVAHGIIQALSIRIAKQGASFALG